MKRILKRNEFFVALVIIVLALIIGIRNPVFFTSTNFVSLVKNSIVPGIMAFALMLGIIAGGIDVSFPAVAVVSMYLTSKLMDSIAYTGSAVWPILMAAAIGTALGLINGIIITKFDLPAFIVTLGTSSVFSGLLISIVGAKPVNRLVQPLEDFSKGEIFRVTSEGSTAILPYTFYFLLAIMIVVYLILNYTMLGRGIYAIGGDRVSAKRAGFNVKGITIFVYAFIGFAAGIAGICHTIQARMSIPTDLMGDEMMIIAAVVLGGTKITGGSGTVLGTALGMFLITMARNSLILLGIPSTAQRFIIGVIIVAGTGLSAYQVLRNSRKIPKILEDKKLATGGASDGK